MYKIAICVRNRLGITKKCISAIQCHSKLPNQIYIFDNMTNYRTKDHFDYFRMLYEAGIIHQYVVNSESSTYKAFSKAAALNQFGMMHELDPDKDNVDFLVFLDNDVIVTPGWDKWLFKGWRDVKKYRMNNIKVIGQLPGGIKYKKEIPNKIAGHKAMKGKYGGSGLWCVRSNFFRDVGILNLKHLIGKNKEHDQQYWRLMDNKNKAQEYILGMGIKLGIHVGKLSGSICNRLTKKPDADITFVQADKKIEELDFDNFYMNIYNDARLINDW